MNKQRPTLDELYLKKQRIEYLEPIDRAQELKDFLETRLASSDFETAKVLVDQVFEAGSSEGYIKGYEEGQNSVDEDAFKIPRNQRLHLWNLISSKASLSNVKNKNDEQRNEMRKINKELTKEFVSILKNHSELVEHNHIRLNF